MRLMSVLLPAALAAVTLSSVAWSEGAAPSLPTRKAGVWELKTVMDEGSGPRDQSIKMCIDDVMEHNTVKASLTEHKAACTTYDVKASDGKTVVDADCMFNERKVISTTTMSGDFKTAFEVKIDSTTSDPKAKDQSIVIKRTITQSGKYLSESCGDLKPGEAEGPDGKRVMVQ